MANTLKSDVVHEPGEQLVFPTDEERLASFARAIDALRRETEARLGDTDVAYIKSIRAVSAALEISGRGLIHVSIEPVSFGIGVLVLSLHKGIELMEIGHAALHGAYDKLPGAEEFQSVRFRWRAPIDEESWRDAHNIRHHQYTNIAGRDPDLDFGTLRLSSQVPHQWFHVLQPVTNLLTWLIFSLAINLHATGLIDVYQKRLNTSQLPDRSLRTRARAHLRFLRKSIPYYSRELIFFPALAGPFFWKVLLGNLLSEAVRDVYAAAIIYCGHVGAREFPKGTRHTGRARFFAAQVEAACDVSVPLLISVLSGALDRQIEHHLFPKLPPNRLREIAPRVRTICAQHGIAYRSEPWPDRLRDVIRTLTRLRHEHGGTHPTFQGAAG